MLPKNSYDSAYKIWKYIRNRDNIKNLGIIITDSHVTPMRKGVICIAIGWCGFKPLYSYLNKFDIHNKPLKVTQVNLLDALATTAVLAMGEGDEKTPMCIIYQVPKVSFTLSRPTLADIESRFIDINQDLYQAIIK